MGMSELWNQEGTFERALYTLRKYGRLHITSYHLYWNIQDLFAFGLSLSFKAFTSPCPFPCFLILYCQSFIAFPPPRFPWGALIQSLPSRACGPRNRSWTLYGRRLPWRIDVPFLCCSVSPADLRIWECVAVVRVRKSNPVSCPQDSQASQNTLDMCERQIPVVSLTEMKNCNSNCFGIPKNSSQIRSIDPWISYQRRVAANQAVVLGPPGLQCWQR